MIPVPGQGATTTRRRSSKTQVTRTTTFLKEIPQLIPVGELLLEHQSVKNCSAI